MTRLPNAVPKPAPREKGKPKPLPRNTKPIARSGRPNPRNAKRSKANQARAYGTYAATIRAMPCLVCCHRPSEAAHTANGGGSRKGDASTLVPLCGPHTVFTRTPKGLTYVNVEGCHRALHRIGAKTFERTYNVNLKARAAELWAERPSQEAPND